MAKKETIKANAELVNEQAKQAEPTQEQLRAAMKKGKNMHDFDKKYEKAGKKDIMEMLGQLSQVLKMFNGIYGQKMKRCNNMTVEEWMDAHGVHRFVTKSGAKKGYTPGIIREAWHKGMKEGENMCLFKNVKASYKPTAEQAEEWGVPLHKALDVYTWEEANKLDGKPIKVYKLHNIETENWNGNKILDGLIQKNEYEKHSKKRAEAKAEFDKIEHFYVVRYDEVEGSIVRRVIEVDANKITL